MKSLGADVVFDYTKEDFTKSGEMYDVIFDVVGKSSFSDYKILLKKNGFLLLANPKLKHVIQGRRNSMKVIAGGVTDETEDLIFLKDLIEKGKLKSVIGRSYTLEQIPEAHRYVEKGQKTGNVVITVVHNNKS
jgi:NADPH:quinone reductase-like Zn-dependent oxidoreductase